MESDLGSAVSIVPYVPVMAAACCKPGLIADLVDLDSWLVAGGLGQDCTLDRTCDAWWKLAGEGGGRRFTLHKYMLSLPANTRNPRHHCFESHEAELPTKLFAANLDTEKISLKCSLTRSTPNIA